MKKRKKSQINKTSKMVTLFLLVITVLVGGWFWYTSAGTGEISAAASVVNALPSANPVRNNINTVVPEDITKGNPEAKAVLIEYGDFQCIACKYMHERFRLIWRVLQDDLYLVYRHYPLSQHVHAWTAARYSEAMHRQGKFWEFHDLLYDQQENWENLSDEGVQNMFDGFVTELGGDLDQVKKDLKDPVMDTKIRQDMEKGDRAGLTGTPTLILNGKKIPIPTDLAKFVSEIKNLN